MALSRAGAPGKTMAVLAGVALILTNGCVLVSGGPPRHNANDNTGPENMNEDPGSGNENDSEPPGALLQVSNPTPALNELVELTCRVVDNGSGSPPEVERYEFFGQTNRLVIDERGGTASFVVTESDVNTSLEFSCRAVLAGGGVSDTSQPVIVIVGE